MNLKQMVQLQEYKNDKLQLDNNEINKKIIKKIEKNKYNDYLLSYKNEIKFAFQGLTFFELSLLTISSKIDSLFYKGSKQERKNYKEEIDSFLRSKWKQREESKKRYSQVIVKNYKLELKSEYQKNLNLKLNKLNTNKKIINENNILISADDKTHQNKFLGMSKNKRIDFKKELKKQKNILKSKNNLSKLEKQIILYEIKSKYSYDGILKYNSLLIKQQYLKKIHNIKENYNIEKDILKNKLIKKIQLKNEKKELSKSFWKNKLHLISDLFKFKLKWKNYKQKNYELTHRYKNELYNLKLQDEYFKNKQDLKHLKISFKQDLRNQKLEYKSNLIELTSQTPISVKKYRKYFSFFMSILIPGTGQLYNGQFIKGIVMILCSMFTWLLIMYSFGIGNIEGNGILGLITLGFSENLWEQKDARFFVIEGALSVILLVLVVIYNIISSREAWHTAIVIENGARVKTWHETKTYMSGIGYPIVTSTPTFIMVLFIVFVPIVTTFLLAFTNYKPNNSTNFEWLGFDNFKGLFTKSWLDTMRYVITWTLVWTVITWFTSFIIAFILASTLNNERVKGKILFRLIYVLPWAIPGFITILLFKLMFMPGSILSQLFNEHNFQSDPFLAKISILMIQMWSGYCVNLVLITGILQSIPKDLYEAAEIDGASSTKKMWKITLPLVIYQMTPILVGQFMGAFNNFGIMYMYLDGGPHIPGVITEGGAGATDTIASLIYKMISGGHVARASALNIIVSVIIVSISVSILVKSKSVKGGVA